MILLLDNTDSFVYNLDRYLQQLGQSTLVLRSDAVQVDAIGRLGCEAIVISPGPKTPDEAGCSLEVIRRLGTHLPILGVCLGHQAIGQAFGGRIVRAAPCHGKVATVEHDGSSMFAEIPNPFQAARYHSLVIEEASLPACLQVTSRSGDGWIMSVRHQELPIWGYQFHPESILTPHGYRLLANFLDMAGIKRREHLPLHETERRLGVGTTEKDSMCMEHVGMESEGAS